MSLRRYQVSAEDKDLVEIDWSYFGGAGILAPYWAEIIACLNYWLGDEFSGPTRFVPAALICNIYGECAVQWRVGLPPVRDEENEKPEKYGKKVIDDSISALKADLRALKKHKKNSRQCVSVGPDERRSIEQRIFLHTGPWRRDLGQMSNLSDDELLDVISEQISTLKEKLDALKAETGKYRAFHVAKSLRAIVEVYTDITPTSGDFPEGHPSGIFSSCLDDLFRILDIQARFRHYSKKAIELPEDAPELEQMRALLRGTEEAVAAFEKSSGFTESR